MPSSMIHLLTAKKYDENSSILFYIGNLAPDCISEWKEKDHSHLRDLEKNQRLCALTNLAKSLDSGNDFIKGILMHLFLDYQWDESPLKNHRESFSDNSWFPSYRKEIGLASAYMFHHTNWGEELWNEMMNYPKERYSIYSEFPCTGIHDFINRNGKWHKETECEPSRVFTPEYIETFTSEAAAEFKKWLKSL